MNLLAFLRALLVLGILLALSRGQSMTPLVGIAAGPDTSFARRADLSVRAFGSGLPRGLSIPGVPVGTGPQTLTGLTGVVEVAAGEGHLLARRVDGSVWTLGAYVPPTGGGTTVPFAVPGVANAIDVDAGLLHSLAVRADGSVLVWGSNWQGQLGVGFVGGPAATPVVVPGLTGATQVAAGDSFSLALFSDGSVRSWGQNAGGQLGLGTVGGVIPTPTVIPGLSGVEQIGARGGVAWAVLANGSVLVWGNNQFSQTGSPPSVPVPVPTTVLGITNVQKVVSGGFHFLALRADGAVLAWGRNVLGMLGVPGAPTNIVATPTLVPLPSAAQDIAAGRLHSLALLASGELHGWGLGGGPPLGLPQSALLTTPTPSPAVAYDATTEPFGFACPIATFGNPILTAYEVPYLGNAAFALEIEKGNTLGGPAWLFASFSLATTPLPMAQGGCDYLLDTSGLLQLTNAGLVPLGPYALSNASPARRVPLPLANIPQLAGASLSFQAAMQPIPSLGFVLTNALTVTLN